MGWDRRAPSSCVGPDRSHGSTSSTTISLGLHAGEARILAAEIVRERSLATRRKRSLDGGPGAEYWQEFVRSSSAPDLAAVRGVQGILQGE